MNSTGDIDWQLVVVLAIIVVAAVWSIIRIIRHFRRNDSSCDSGCAGCPIRTCSADKRKRPDSKSL